MFTTETQSASCIPDRGLVIFYIFIYIDKDKDASTNNVYWKELCLLQMFATGIEVTFDVPDLPTAVDLELVLGALGALSWFFMA